MSDFSLSETLLTAMIAYGPVMLGVALLLGELGIPIPGTLMLLATGAFVRQGLIGWVEATSLGLIGAVLGDSASYAIGRFTGAWADRRFGQMPAWQSAQSTFDQRGGLAVFLTRFLLTPLALPVNLIAGGSRYVFWRFFVFVLAGEVTWVAIYTTVGYAVGSQFEAVSQFVSDMSGVLVGVVVLAIGIYFFVRGYRRRTANNNP